MKEERGLRYFPIALFASVMGLSGVTYAFKQYEEMYELNHIVSNAFLMLTMFAFLINGCIFLLRVIKYPQDVRTELNHPVKMNFFGAISISFLMLGLLMYDLNESVSFVLWLIGALLQLLLTLLILTKLMWETSFKLEQFSPVWFLPIVGNIVVPLAGEYHVSIEINWFFYSIGIIFSIIYFTLIMNRLFFKGSLPIMLRPTLFILLAPPSIGFMSYIKLSGQIDTFAYILYGFAFYFGLLLIFQIKHFIRTPFFVSWWAMLFPTAAMTNATFMMYSATESTYLKYFMHLQVLGLLILSLYLLVKTLKLLLKKKLCVKN